MDGNQESQQDQVKTMVLICHHFHEKWVLYNKRSHKFVGEIQVPQELDCRKSSISYALEVAIIQKCKWFII